MRLANKVALITGATGGVGSASARLFAQEGAAVVIAAKEENPGNALAKEINAAGGKALFVKLDVSDQKQWDDAVKQVKEKFGALHILVNAAETHELSMITHAGLKTWNKVFEINLTGTLLGIQTCAPLMKASGGGAIVNIGSVAGLAGSFSTAYSATKWGLEGLSRSAAYILSDWGIRCNVIQSGMIATDMPNDFESSPEAKKAISDSVLLRRKGKPEEIAYAALFLASEDSSYITGNDIVVDGGWFSAAPYLVNERQSHTLEMLQKKLEGSK
jgi:NAD(P)-dependent dehydrogenase (short-subunit alcohol dehydrogenase family)